MPSLPSRALTAAALAIAIALAAPPAAAQTGAPTTGDPFSAEGVVKVRSAYPIDETIERLKRDVAAKGIVFFQEIDQAKLAAAAGVKLPRSTLLVFGNPPLGTLFLTSNPLSGLDWPVRLLVFEDTKGQVWTAYTDFSWIARRHGIKDRKAQFATASGVIASITSSVAAR